MSLRCFVFVQNLETPLHLSVKNLQFHAIHMLLESGCNINATDKVCSAKINDQTTVCTICMSVCSSTTVHLIDLTLGGGVSDHPRKC